MTARPGAQLAAMDPLPNAAPLPQLVAQHMGNLHPFEQAIVLLIAFGPFVILAAVVWTVRRRDIADEEGAGRPAAGGVEGEDTDVSRATPPAS